VKADSLSRVRKAAARKAAADNAYRAALVAAHDAGLSYAAIAAAAGVSRQAVRQLVERAR
jgi:DNA-directed RNA polymerase specialized sigma24 family protein